MTSTGTFQGLADGRNSSKVLKPPGGGSSDIFGAGPDESPRRVKHHNQSQLGSALFGDGGGSTGSSSPETPRANKPDGNPVTGAGYMSDHQNNSVASHNGSSSASINGDSKSTTDSSPASTKQGRTRVPPGGFSSGLW